MKEVVEGLARNTSVFAIGVVDERLAVAGLAAVLAGSWKGGAKAMRDPR